MTQPNIEDRCEAFISYDGAYCYKHQYTEYNANNKCS